MALEGRPYLDPGIGEHRGRCESLTERDGLPDARHSERRGEL
jgi:hypothetical protein